MQLDEYIGKITKYPQFLTNEEACELVRKAHNGNEQAREKLITSNLRFVVNVALRYVSPE